MFIGARIIKTGLSVTISMFLAGLLNIQPAVFTAISAVGNLKPSVAQSWRDAFQQVIVHIISVGIGLVVGYLFGGNPLTMGFSTVLIILICLKFNWKNSVLMGIVASIFILDASEEAFLTHALTRSSGVFIGLGVALAINSLLAPPRHKNRLLASLKHFHHTAVLEFSLAVEQFISLQYPKISNPEIKPLISEVRELLQYYHEEIHSNWSLRALPKSDEKYYDYLTHLTDYSVGLLERAETIRNIIPARISRRKKAGNLPISEEFEQILKMLGNVSETIQKLNDKLQSNYFDGVPVEPEEITDNFWLELNKIIDKWQHKFTGHYYLYALMEVALVAHEIRWATREAKCLLFEAVEITSEP